MKQVLAPRAQAAGIDFKKSLLETFAIHEMANQLLLGTTMLTCQAGHSLPAKLGFALWQCDSLWRESGFGK
jgi:hypothetical protein